MADSPAVVALAKSQYDRNPEYDDDDRLLAWDEIEPEHRASLIKGAALDYAFVLRDLMQPSEAKLVVNEMLRARAREIGVEI